MSFDLVTVEQRSPADREAILQALIAYNDIQAGPAGFKPLGLLMRDPATGQTIGGLWGGSSYDWFYVEMLVVPEALRGQGLGTQLLRQAEAVAVQRGCHGIWLDTFHFQARGFYEKLGYEPFGVLEDHPRGGSRTFLRKLLPPAARLPQSGMA